MNRILLSSVLALYAVTAFAQTAETTGRISDPTGSVVAEARIAVIDLDTGIERESASNVQGYYTIPSLTPGNYQIRVSKAGFKTVVRSGIRLLANDKVRIDFVLELGALAETVTVNSDVSLIATDTAEVGGSITNREYNRLPLIQVGRMRQPANFLFLTPGVHGNLDPNGVENVTATNQIQVNGSPKQHTEVWMDGISGGQAGTVGSMNEMSPPVDAILEFKVQSSQMSAEYGHSGAAVVNFTVKSGTNELHGGASEYFRNDKLDARNFLASSRALTRQNEFGVTLGGPVYVPKVYNGRDRTFFFFAWTSSRKRGMDNIERARIGTPQQVAGDFSGVLDGKGARVPIYDPQTTRSDGKGGFIRDPFAGNIIPANRLDPVAVEVGKLLPAPNTSAAGNLNYQDWVGEQQLDPDVLTAKVDHNFSSRQKIFGTFNWNRIPRLRNRVPLPDPVNDGFIQNITSRVFRFNYDFIVRPNLLNTLSLGYNRFRNPNGSRSYQQGWPEKIGLKNTVVDLFPTLSFTNGYATMGSSSFGDSIDQQYFFRDVVGWTRGLHTVKFGMEVRAPQINSRSKGNSGSYSFNALGTGLPGNSSTGDAFASFMLGQVQSASMAYPSNTGTRRPYWGWFVQDDYKITPRLTLNLGFRFELEEAPYEAADRYSIVDLTTPNPGAGNLPGALIFAGSGPGRTGRRTLTPTDYSGLGPRIGFAWRVGAKTAVRGGYGIYYSNVYLGVSTAGFNISGNFASTDNGVTPAFVLRDGFPQNFSREPTISPTVLNDQNATYAEPSAGAMPRTQNWSLGIQHEIKPNLMFEALYIANHNTRANIPQLVNINQLDPKYLSLGSLLTNSITSAQARAANIPVPYPGFSGSVAQALRAFPQYRTMTAATAKAGSSIYHAMELHLRKRLSHGLSFDASYTFSKNIGYNNPSYAGNAAVDDVLQDNWNRKLERSVLPYDIPHAFLLTYAYDLPFQKSGALGKFVTGWSISGINRYQNGNPLAVLMSNSLPIFNRVLRPDRVLGANPSTGIAGGDFDPNVDRVINPAAFAAPGPYRFGTSAPYIQNLRNFFVFGEDVSVLKNTKVNERFSTELTAHFINLFNRHRFTEVDTNFSNTTFGRTKSASFPRFIQLGIRLRF